MTKKTDFDTLHQHGTFVMPNPWDRGSALVLQELGFPALATTSSGLGRSIGKDDQEVTRDELIAHVAEITSVLDVPLNVDSERLYPDEPGGIATTVRMLADAGASGCSIEDYDPSTQSIDEVDRAANAVAVAAQACAEHSLLLTARAENHLYGANDLDNTVERLLAYQGAGCDVLYAPGLKSIADISRVVSQVERPINVLAMPDAPSVPELAKLGVRRVSIGGSLYNAAYRSLRIAAEEVRDHGTSDYARR
ncbi:MAG: isocitrate lyase/phosphoenolpyruvate mutase family protein [Acidimicrobiales bacterium]